MEIYPQKIFTPNQNMLTHLIKLVMCCGPEPFQSFPYPELNDDEYERVYQHNVDDKP